MLPVHSETFIKIINCHVKSMELYFSPLFFQFFSWLLPRSSEQGLQWLAWWQLNWSWRSNNKRKKKPRCFIFCKYFTLLISASMFAYKPQCLSPHCTQLKKIVTILLEFYYLLLIFLSPQNKFDPNWSEEEKEAYYKRKQKTTFKVLQHPHVMKHPVYN